MKEENKSWDYLKILTKEQIIVFLKEKYWNPPTEKDVKCTKWEIVSNELLKKMKDYTYSGVGERLAKEYDEIVAQINNEKDMQKITKLFEKLENVRKKYDSHRKEGETLNKKYNENEKLYEESQS